MIYWLLFWTFFQAGAFSFGGGFGMISVIRDQVLMHEWLTEEELLNIIAVAESTPGPIAVNIATFVGAEQAGVFGALLATLGIVLPSFIIILIIAAFAQKLMKYAPVQAFLGGIRPCVVGMILAMSGTLLLQQTLGLGNLYATIAPELRAMILLAGLFVNAALYHRLTKKQPSPILMILLSAGLGMLFYGV